MWETVDISEKKSTLNMSNITFEVARSSNSDFKKCQKIYSRLYSLLIA